MKKICLSCARDFSLKANNTGDSVQKYCSRKCSSIKFHKKDSYIEEMILRELSTSFILLSDIVITISPKLPNVQKENIRMAVRRLILNHKIIAYQKSHTLKSLNFKGDISLKLQVV